MVLPILALAAVAFAPGQTIQNGDHAYDRVIYTEGTTGQTITGDFSKQKVLIRASNCKKLTIRDLKLGTGSAVQLAGCTGHTARNIWLGKDAHWSALPVAISREHLKNDMAWISASNGAFVVGGSRRHNFQQRDGEPARISAPRGELKIGWNERNQVFDLSAYQACVVQLRDSAGQIHSGKITGWQFKTDTVIFSIVPVGKMAKGWGYWQIDNPSQYQRGLVYENFRAAHHAFVSIFFADGVTVKNSDFYSARLDYNLGFENCRNVTLTNVKSTGNRSLNGNNADVAFLFGIKGLKSAGNQIETFAITSAGWEVSGVDVDQKVSWLDEGWFGKTVEKGKVTRDSVGRWQP